MHTTEPGAPCATGNATPKSVPPQTGVVVSSSIDVAAERQRLHGAITRAWSRKDRARTDAEAGDAQNTINRLANELARLAAQPQGRVPSQDVCANSPGYTPGLSRRAISEPQS
jgi:hypothetical protein